MNSEATAPYAVNVSKAGHVLVVAYHCILGGVVGITDFVWIRSSLQGDKAIFALSMMPFFPLLYVSVGWGIWNWKSWSRTLSLVLNWLGLFGAVAGLARFQAKGVFGVLFSGLVLWWLSVPAVKLQFRKRSEPA